MEYTQREYANRNAQFQADIARKDSMNKNFVDYVANQTCYLNPETGQRGTVQDIPGASGVAVPSTTPGWWVHVCRFGIEVRPGAHYGKRDFSQCDAGHACNGSPEILLFDAPAVAVAAVLGGPLGGCVAMALNYRRLDKPAAAAAAVTIGAAMTVLLVLLGYHVDARPAQAIGIVTLLLMRRIAEGCKATAWTSI